VERRFLDGSGTISLSGDQVTMRIDRRAYTAAACTSSSANPGSKKLHGNRR
jgi:hypothetical protein